MKLVESLTQQDGPIRQHPRLARNKQANRLFVISQTFWVQEIEKLPFIAFYFLTNFTCKT